MGRRKIGWEDKSVTSGFRDELKGQRYDPRPGIKDIMCVATDCEEFLEHIIDDVSQKEDGTYNEFSKICCKTWSDEEGDWVGDCPACDKGYRTKIRFVAGVILGAELKGERMVKVNPEDCCRFWFFANDKYTQIREIVFGLKHEGDGKKRLRDIRLICSLKDGSDAKVFKKMNILRWNGNDPITREHILVAKEQLRDLVEKAVRPTTVAEMKRELTPRGKARRVGSGAETQTKSGSSKRSSRREDPDPKPLEESVGEFDNTNDPEMDDLMSQI